MITSSSIRALQGQRVRSYLSIFTFLVFAFSRGFPCSFNHIFSFRRFTLSFNFRRLFGARQLIAGVFRLPTW